MAGSKTQYLAQKQLDHALGGPVWTPPPTLWVCLSTAPFTSAATGTAMDEIAVPGYSRLEIANNAATWSAATYYISSEKHNAGEFLWPPAAADNSWGIPASVYLADAATNGNLLYGTDISNGEEINPGDSARVPANAFIVLEG